jgi:protein-glutamine gamma-glutamyltransferase
MRAFMQRRMAAWIRRRQGPDLLPVTLQRRRLYILPTRAGIAYGALLLLMLVAGLNYANSLALLTTFLLVGLALVAMHACHRNLLGLRVAELSCPDGIEGAQAALRLRLANDSAQPRVGIELDGTGQPPVTCNMPANGDVGVSLRIATPLRGAQPVGRLRIMTTWPFGLFRAWTWLHAPHEVTVYPAMGPALRESGQADEWTTLRPFRDGDSPRQVAWKAYARGAPLLVKEYNTSSAWAPESAPRRDPPIVRNSAAKPMAPASPLRVMHWVISAYLIGALLHLGQVPWWVSAVACGGAGWALAAAHGRVRLPSRFFKICLAVVLTATVLAMFHTLNGLNAGSALLVVMGAIKLLEATSRRDRLIVVGVGFYLLLAACLVSQQMLRTPLYLLEAWVCCTALLYAAHPDAPTSSRAAARVSARSLALALPLALLLFALFPRLSGSFWSLAPSNAAQTGLSDTMSPGSISELGNSIDPVFRVWFDGPLPPPPQRYWRGPVLHDFDGYTWTRVHGNLFRPETLQFLGPAYHYHIRLEPDSTPWWPALDTVQSAMAPGTLITPDRQLLAYRPVHDAVMYSAVSYTATESHDQLSRVARQFDTAFARQRNPRSQALAEKMRAAAPDVPAYVSSVLALFRDGHFEYTLTPPLLDPNSVDDFLFHTRQGFCGHFASAFAMLMRAGGVPARVVTGYQGGEWNPIGGYLLVRRSDAHAWVEVWEDDRGWVRVDPTAVVAPERLSRGFFDLLPEAGSVPERLLHEFSWLQQGQQAWDALNAWWSTRLVAYNYGSQMQLLSWLGFGDPDWQQLGWLLAAALILWLLVIGWQFSRVRAPAGTDRLASAYLRLCARLARHGPARQPHQGPLTYAALFSGAATTSPGPRAQAAELLNIYARLRYGSVAPTAAQLREFERRVNRWQPPRRSVRESRGK